VTKQTPVRISFTLNNKPMIDVPNVQAIRQLALRLCDEDRDPLEACRELLDMLCLDFHAELRKILEPIVAFCSEVEDVPSEQQRHRYASTYLNVVDARYSAYLEISSNEINMVGRKILAMTPAEES
jgi:hypothetical protein